jgi:hypothetical protein
MRTWNPIESIRRGARNSPWVVMSVIVHVIVIAGLSVMYMHEHAQRSEEPPGVVVVAPPHAVEPVESIAPPEPIERHAVPPDDIGEITDRDVVYVPTSEPPTEADLKKDLGDPLATTTFEDPGGPLSSTAIGVGAVGTRGGGPTSTFNRRPGAGTGTLGPGRTPLGPTKVIDKAVLDGLRWLVRHQAEDGSWSVASLKDRCDPGRPCAGERARFTDSYDVGTTGLALLCFLGAGFSNLSRQDLVDPIAGKRYKIGEVVKNGLKWLADRQNPDGSFSKDRSFIYNESLATMALAEAYGLSRTRFWKEPAQRGVDFIMRAQRPSPYDPNGSWGWRYGSRMEIEDPRKTTGDESYKRELFDSDTSATCWAVMALKSAELAKLSVKKESLDGAFEYAKFVTGDNGLVGYQDPKNAGAVVSGKNDHFTYHTACMSALGMCIRIFTQHDAKDTFLELAAKQIVKDLPAISKDKLSIDYYYWYYGSLALNQLDGPESPSHTGKFWNPWNKAMVDALLALQDQTEHACSHGGWLTPDRWAYTGGPLYTTAINVLTLEVYFRYENAFGAARR